MVQGIDAPASVVVDLRDESLAGLLAQFTRLRARTFALVQRRGLNVWEWTSRGRGPFQGATAYQFLQAVASSDGELLAAVRGAARGVAAA